MSEAIDSIDPIKDKQEYKDAVKSALSNIANDAQSSGTNVNN
ncbi:hypothetical protein [Flavobacterium sp. 140616W15]|nr:hypothetical protein [Flavobacterium sp. 140616W15]